MCRAIKSIGNFKHHESYSHYHVDIDSWGEMSNEQQSKRETKFLSEKGRSKQNQCVSTDGTRIVLKTPSAGKTETIKRKKGREDRNGDY